MNIENYENLSNEVSANLKEQGLTKGEIATVGYLLLSKNFNSIIDEMKFNNNLKSLLKKAENLLAWNYMFISACLSEDDYNRLKEKWNAEGGCEVTPWWLFVAQNAVVGINI